MVSTSIGSRTSTTLMSMSARSHVIIGRNTCVQWNNTELAWSPGRILSKSYTTREDYETSLKLMKIIYKQICNMQNQQNIFKQRRTSYNEFLNVDRTQTGTFMEIHREQRKTTKESTINTIPWKHWKSDNLRKSSTNSHQGKMTNRRPKREKGKLGAPKSENGAPFFEIEFH